MTRRRRPWCGVFPGGIPPPVLVMRKNKAVAVLTTPAPHDGVNRMLRSALGVSPIPGEDGVPATPAPPLGLLDITLHLYQPPSLFGVRHLGAMNG